MPVIGFLSIRSSDTDTQFLVSLRQGLSEGGFVEGRNVAVEYRYAQGQPDRLPSLAADLVRRQVAIIVTTGGAQAALAAKAATTAIPIVFTTGSDTVREGLVQSFNRPGGNLTGVTTWHNEAAPKRLGLLREILPNAAIIVVLVNPNDPSGADTETNLMRAAARSIEAGGLMSYGSRLGDAIRVVGVYAGRILKGEKPGDLPVQQPTKFELVVNLKAAKAIGLTIPESFLARADEVIE